jgi:hypothetical protein
MFEHAEENRAEIDGIVNAGVYIMGRNMFGPGRGGHVVHVALCLPDR